MKNYLVIVTVSEESWNSYTELTKVLNQYLLMGARNVPIIELESVLRKYKQNFFTILQNPVSFVYKLHCFEGMVDFL